MLQKCLLIKNNYRNMLHWIFISFKFSQIFLITVFTSFVFIKYNFPWCDCTDRLWAWLFTKWIKTAVENMLGKWYFTISSFLPDTPWLGTQIMPWFSFEISSCEIFSNIVCLEVLLIILLFSTYQKFLTSIIGSEPDSLPFGLKLTAIKSMPAKCYFMISWLLPNTPWPGTQLILLFANEVISFGSFCCYIFFVGV